MSTTTTCQTCEGEGYPHPSPNSNIPCEACDGTGEGPRPYTVHLFGGNGWEQSGDGCHSVEEAWAGASSCARRGHRVRVLDENGDPVPAPEVARPDGELTFGPGGSIGFG